VDGYRLIDTVLVVPMREERTHKKVIELYEHLLSTKNLPPLLRNYLTLDEVKKEDVTDSYSLSERHLGQMNASYPLTKGQREALHHFLTLVLQLQIVDLLHILSNKRERFGRNSIDARSP